MYHPSCATKCDHKQYQQYIKSGENTLPLAQTSRLEGVQGSGIRAQRSPEVSIVTTSFRSNFIDLNLSAGLLRHLETQLVHCN
jgi:hypothetical protein